MSALRKARVDARLSIEELSIKSGVSADQILNIETGRTVNPRAATLAKLADVLVVEPSTIDPVLTRDAA